MWGSTVLHAHSLTASETFRVGSDCSKKAPCDFYLPEEAIGAQRHPLVRSVEGAFVVTLPRDCTGSVRWPGEGEIPFEKLVDLGRARASLDIPGTVECTLPVGADALVECRYYGISFRVQINPRPRSLNGDRLSQFEATAYAITSLSLVLHLGVVASMAYFMPHLSEDDTEALDRDHTLAMMKLLSAAAEREQEREHGSELPLDAAEPAGGASAQKHVGPEGAVGKPDAPSTPKRFAIHGPADNTDIRLPRDTLTLAREFGMLGILAESRLLGANAPTSPFGSDEPLGRDTMDARGLFTGEGLGDSWGQGGLALTGVGQGGGGTGAGIGLDSLGTLYGGRGHGTATGVGEGFGRGSGSLRGNHVAQGPQIRVGTAEVRGRLPAEVIQRVVRANLGRFRQCYEQGLRTNPSLAGRVTVKFVIDRTGAVSLASQGDSDIADNLVVACIVRQFGNLSFPAPEGGVVTVVYPFALTSTN
jgi:hypothetical protein